MDALKRLVSQRSVYRVVAHELTQDPDIIGVRLESPNAKVILDRAAACPYRQMVKRRYLGDFPLGATVVQTTEVYDVA